jgi:hypothetical protein
LIMPYISFNMNEIASHAPIMQTAHPLPSERTGRMRRTLLVVILLVVSGLGLYSCFTGDFIAPGAVSAYILLMVLPGAGFYLLVERDPALLELALASFILSPIFVSIVAVFAMLSGADPKTAALSVTLPAAAFAVLVGLSRNPLALAFAREVSLRQGLVLFGTIAAFCALTGYLPLTEEWWRMRSDAWFHLSVVAQISDYGVPPEDPYFYGMPLQYMWFYHVLVIIVSRATGITPPFMMALFNIQALAGFMLAVFLLAQLLKNRFAHGMSSMLTAVLGINALFWLFLPIKLARALVGEDRGMEVVRRALTLSPLDNLTVRNFLVIHHNQYFFFNKFIVLTAFSIALSFMAACWYGMAGGLAKKRTFAICLVFFAAVGMLAFHPIVGFISLAGLGGGIALFYLDRSTLSRASRKTSLLLFVALAAAVVVLSPYLYSVMHGKESGQLLPVHISFHQFLGLVIACAAGILLAAFQVKKLLANQTAEARFFVLAALCTIIVCLFIHLPGPNKIDKPPFFMFFPLAIAGGWTLAELSRSNISLFRKKIGVVLVFVLLFFPLNFIGFLGDYATPVTEVFTPEEARIAEWARANTSRDAVFIDNKDRNFILVAGPRRNYFGSPSYAMQWGYDKEEMKQRQRVTDNIFSSEPLERSTISALCTIEPNVYIVLRGPEESHTTADKFLQLGDLFTEAFSTGPASVLQVNKEACDGSGAE